MEICESECDYLNLFKKQNIDLCERDSGIIRYRMNGRRVDGLIGTLLLWHQTIPKHVKD